MTGFSKSGLQLANPSTPLFIIQLDQGLLRPRVLLGGPCGAGHDHALAQPHLLQHRQHGRKDDLQEQRTWDIDYTHNIFCIYGRISLKMKIYKINKASSTPPPPKQKNLM